jgi:DNA-binding response OmpR family regulator
MFYSSTTTSHVRKCSLTLQGPGHRACVARDAASALQRCSEETFDLILMDIGLPDGDGLDVCCELRSNGRAEETCIVALTGHVDLKGSSCMSDFDGCIAKPITMQALEDILGTAMTPSV